MRILWGRANSSNVMKVMWLLEELGLPYERRDAGGAFGPLDAAKNPNRLVPALEEEGWLLWESNAICRYLVDAHAPGHAWHPADARARADADRWADWQQTTLSPDMTKVFFGWVRTPPEQRDMSVIRAAEGSCVKRWQMVEEALAGRDHLAGTHPGLGDLALGIHIHRWFAMPVESPEFPALRAWYGRLLARPAYAAHVAVKLT
jgi:glutathione S-transferase